MAAKFTAIYKIVQPSPEATRVTDSQSMTDAGVYGNYSWYQRLIQGSGSRLTRYREYDLMNNDVDVARALDTIAEEMCGNDQATDECLVMEVVAEDESLISDTEVLTVKAALRHWINIHKWDTRLFKIARMMVMYGDVFFRKKKESTQWEFIHPKHVVGAIVDKDDITKILGWQIRKNTKESRSTYGVPLTTSSAQDYSEVIPVREIVRFTLNDDMSDTAPFGESVLSPVYRSHKQKELLEDSVVIYRIQRAPERRVFYIDVGKMPPQRSKQYLEQIKNEIKQKKVPTMNGGTDEIDSVYNPQSMSEDFFFAQRADGRGSRVETLPGGQGLGELSDLEYFMDKVIRGLRIPYSYMYQNKEGGTPWNDGKVGVSYIQELRFALFIIRLQQHVEEVLDDEFKKYLKFANIIVSDFDYKTLVSTVSKSLTRIYLVHSAQPMAFNTCPSALFLSATYSYPLKRSSRTRRCFVRRRASQQMRIVLILTCQFYTALRALVEWAVRVVLAARASVASLLHLLWIWKAAT
jgi:hypothetical protein